MAPRPLASVNAWMVVIGLLSMNALLRSVLFSCFGTGLVMGKDHKFVINIRV